MEWVESISPSFRARHDAAEADAADRVLYGLERTRARLERVFPRMPVGMTVVLHGGPLGLAFTNPLLPVMWTVAAPASRRYIAGWVSRREMHVLAPSALEARASNVQGSREMLALSPAALYTRRVIDENSPTLSNATPLSRVGLELRWAWLLEGGARWFAGQIDHARPAIARRLREGPPAEFPPGVRDAPLLGQTVIDLLAQTRGEEAVVRFVCQPESGSPRRMLLSAFGSHSLARVETSWRSHLMELASGARPARSRRRAA